MISASLLARFLFSTYMTAIAWGDWCIKLRLAFEFPRILAASKDINTTHMLIHRASIIAEGNSMGEFDITLIDKVTKVFEDISPLFPTLHEHRPDDPDASHIFNAVIMGVVLTLTKIKGGLEALELLLGAIHQSTVLLRALPIERQLPNSECSKLFKEIVGVISDTVLIGWGKNLNPTGFIRKDTIEDKLSYIRTLVRILIETGKNLEGHFQELYPVTRSVA